MPDLDYIRAEIELVSKWDASVGSFFNCRRRAFRQLLPKHYCSECWTRSIAFVSSATI